MTRMLTIVFCFMCLSIKTSSFAMDLQDMSYGVLDRHWAVSFVSCRVFCDSLSSCVSAKYYRHYRLCVLYDNDNSEDERGAFKYSKTASIRESLRKACQGCSYPEECQIESSGNESSVTCTFRRCPVLDDVSGAQILGNKRSIGSKVKIRCMWSKHFAIVECQENGTWTPHNLECLCVAPTVPFGKVIMTRAAADTVTAEVLCNDGYSLFVPVFPVCDTTSGDWSPSFDNVCCDILHEGRWTKIFRYPTGTDEGVMGWWRSKQADPKLIKQTCMYRNVTILADWNGLIKLNSVRFDIIKDEQVVAYILFDAVGTNYLDWFTQKRIRDSSWVDLNPYEDIQVFTSVGQALYDSVVRFFIGKKVDETDCHHDTGWLAVTWHSYPCAVGAPITETMKLIYAPGNTHTEFSEGSIAYGDRFEIWVEEENWFNDR